MEITNWRVNSGSSLQDDRKIVNIALDNKVFMRIERATGYTPVLRYQYDNHLGSACLELDNTGAIISYEEYHPFGTTSYRAGRSETEVSQKRYKYCGKERDEETGLYYYGARYYAAWLGRFVSCDPLQHEQPNKTPYHYCSNNPVNKVDPTGMLDDDPPQEQQQFVNFYLNTQGDIISTMGPFEENASARLIPLNKDGTINTSVEPLVINNKEILFELSLTKADNKGGKLSYYSSTDATDIFDTFVFVANNSDVEWALYGYDASEGKVDYVIGRLSTDRRFDHAPALNSTIGYNELDLLFHMHSHPGEDGTKGGSGDPGGNDPDRRVGGDMALLISKYYRFEKAEKNLPKHYVYHPHSKALYQYTPWKSSIPTKSIESGKSFNFAPFIK